MGIDFSEVAPPAPSNFNYRHYTVMFAEAMAREMRANEIKGAGLPILDKERLVGELYHHAEKLSRACQALEKDKAEGENSSEWLKNRILEFSADVANCAMFFASAYGVLTVEQIEKRRSEGDFMENTYEKGDVVVMVNP